MPPAILKPSPRVPFCSSISTMPGGSLRSRCEQSETTVERLECLHEDSIVSAELRMTTKIIVVMVSAWWEGAHLDQQNHLVAGSLERFNCDAMRNIDEVDFVHP